MRRSLFVAAFLLTATLTFAQAPMQQGQPEPPPQQKHAHKTAMRMSKELGLSGEQVSKLEPILADRKQKVQAVRANTALTGVQRKQQLKAIHQSSKTQLAGILTPQQMKQLHAMQRERQASKTPTGI